MSERTLSAARVAARTMMLVSQRQAVEELADAHQRALEFIRSLNAVECCHCHGWIREGEGLSWDDDGEELMHDECYQAREHDQRVDAAEARLDRASPF